MKVEELEKETEKMSYKELERFFGMQIRNGQTPKALKIGYKKGIKKQAKADKEMFLGIIDDCDFINNIAKDLIKQKISEGKE